MIKFPLNDTFKNLIKKKNKKLSYFELLFSGILAGASQLFVVYPMDLMRTRMSLDNKMEKNNTTIRKCFVNMYRKEGILACYKGVSYALLTYPLYVGLQMSLYSTFKDKTNNKLLSGGMAGLIAQTLLYPGDTLKRNLQLDGINGQKKYKGLIDCVRHIFKNKGISGFYPGILINTIKSVPAAAIQFSVYDYCKEYGINELNR